jgi:hypothetical protein
MKTRKIKTISFWLRIFLLTLTIVLLQTDQSQGQVFEIKKWTGTYPDMNGSYPLTFIAFKGFIFPTPYVFVRIWPSHYYVTEALPVTDESEISGELKTGLLRIAAKLLERSRMKGRFEKTTGIKNNTELQNEIEQKLFSARFNELEDIYELAQKFVEAYQKTDRFDELNNGFEVKRLLEKDTDELFMRFLLVNLLESDHGQKVDSFGELQTELNHLHGELDYTFKKLQFFENFGETTSVSYSILTQ